MASGGVRYRVGGEEKWENLHTWSEKVAGTSGFENSRSPISPSAI
jgi:hypothetical protein